MKIIAKYDPPKQYNVCFCCCWWLLLFCCCCCCLVLLLLSLFLLFVLFCCFVWFSFCFHYQIQFVNYEHERFCICTIAVYVTSVNDLIQTLYLLFSRFFSRTAFWCMGYVWPGLSSCNELLDLFSLDYFYGSTNPYKRKSRPCLVRGNLLFSFMNRETWEIVSAKSHAYLKHSMFKNTLKNVTQKNAVLAAVAFVVVNTSMKIIKTDH